MSMLNKVCVLGPGLSHDTHGWHWCPVCQRSTASVSQGVVFTSKWAGIHSPESQDDLTKKYKYYDILWISI